MKKFAICAEHFIKPGAIEAWMRLARMNSEASLKEAGCERFDVLLDRGDTNHAFLYEIYENRMAWLEHCEQPHFRAFVEGIANLVEKKVRGEFDLLLHGF